MMDPSKLYNNWDFLMFLNQKMLIMVVHFQDYVICCVHYAVRNVPYLCVITKPCMSFSGYIQYYPIKTNYTFV
jgi:hypothetical protein